MISDKWAKWYKDGDTLFSSDVESSAGSNDVINGNSRNVA